MPRKLPNPIDVHVGSRVRLRRMLLGMSQERLGESLGLTFQQIQKYEKGANRIGGSRLFQIAQILNVPVQFFYDDMPGGGKPPVAGLEEPNTAPFLISFVNSSEGIQLNQAFMKIKSPRVRRKIIDLVKTLAREDNLDPAFADDEVEDGDDI